MNKLKAVAAVVIERMAPLDLFGLIQAFMVAASPDPENPKGRTIPKLENTLYRRSIRSSLPSDGQSLPCNGAAKLMDAGAAMR